MTEENRNLLILVAGFIALVLTIATACTIQQKNKNDCIVQSTQILQIEKCF